MFRADDETVFMALVFRVAQFVVFVCRFRLSEIPQYVYPASSGFFVCDLMLCQLVTCPELVLGVPYSRLCLT